MTTASIGKRSKVQICLLHCSPITFACSRLDHAIILVTKKKAHGKHSDITISVIGQRYTSHHKELLVLGLYLPAFEACFFSLHVYRTIICTLMKRGDEGCLYDLYTQHTDSVLDLVTVMLSHVHPLLLELVI